MEYLFSLDPPCKPRSQVCLVRYCNLSFSIYCTDMDSFGKLTKASNYGEKQIATSSRRSWKEVNEI